MVTKLKTFIKLIKFNLLFLFIFYLLIELSWFFYFSKLPTFSLNIKTNVNRYYSVDHLYGSKYEKSQYTRDKYSFRGDYDEINSIDILVMGGSTTDQQYIDNSQTWDFFLQKELSSHFDKKVTIVNAGVNGHSSVGHILSMEQWISKIPNFHATYILFYIGINDLFVDYTTKDLPLTHYDSIQKVSFSHYFKRSLLFIYYDVFDLH